MRKENLTHKIVRLSIFLAIGIVLNIVESMIPIPIPIPGVRLGLANTLGLIVLFFYSPKEYIAIGDHWNYNRLSTSWWPIEFYQIASDKEIYISSIIAKSLDLKKEDIEKANQKLNTEIIKINKLLIKRAKK